MIETSQNGGLASIVLSPYRALSSYTEANSVSQLRKNIGYNHFVETVAKMYNLGKQDGTINSKADLANQLGYKTGTIDSILSDAKRQGIEVKTHKMDSERVDQLVKDYQTQTDRSVKDIAKDYGISSSYAYKLIKQKRDAGEDIGYRRQPATVKLSDYAPQKATESRWLKTGFARVDFLGRFFKSKAVKYIGVALASAAITVAGMYQFYVKKVKSERDVWKAQAMEFLAESNELTALKFQQRDTITALTEQNKALKGQVTHWRNRQATDEAISNELAEIVRGYVAEKELKMNVEQNALEEGQRVHRIVSHESFRLPSRLARAIIDTKTGIIDEICILPYQRPRVFTKEAQLEQLADAVASVYMPNEIDPNAFENSQAVNQDADLKTVEKTSVHMTNLDRLFLFIQEYLDSYKNGPLPGFVVRRFDDQNKVVLVGSEEDVLNLKSGRINLK